MTAKKPTRALWLGHGLAPQSQFHGLSMHPRPPAGAGICNVQQSRTLWRWTRPSRESAKVVKSILQERISERRCEQSKVIKVTETSSHDLDETSMSLRHGSVRGSVKREGKVRRRKILRFL